MTINHIQTNIAGYESHRLEQLDQLCQGRVDSVVMVHLIPARQAMLSRGSFGPTQAIRR